MHMLLKNKYFFFPSLVILDLSSLVMMKKSSKVSEATNQKKDVKIRYRMLKRTCNVSFPNKRLETSRASIIVIIVIFRWLDLFCWLDF